jgi:ABC-type uncharacterized transport system permease subunit
MSKYLRYILFWLPMPVLGILNGSLRELFLKSYFEEHIAQRASVFTLIVLIFIYGLVIRKKVNLISLSDAIICSISWLLLTICFEFGFGHFVFDIPYEKLLADYNILEGRLWPLVLFFTGLMPFILRRLNNAV